jgi:hypothetical protein
MSKGEWLLHATAGVERYDYSCPYLDCGYTELSPYGLLVLGYAFL